MSFPKRVLSSRKKLNLSQQQLADIIGVSRSGVNFWENPIGGEEMYPHPKSLEKLAKALNVSASWLRFGDTDNFQPQDYKMIVAKSENEHIIHDAPILKAAEIGEWIELKRSLMQKGVQMSTKEIQEVCFKYEVIGDSMLSMTDPLRSFVPGEIVSVDPLCVGGLKSGDMVLAQFGMTDNFKARIYNIDGLDIYLSCVNQLVAHQAVNDNVRIIGKITSSERKR